MSMVQGTGRRTASAARSARQPGWWYPWLFVAAFALVIGVNGVMIKLAVGSFSGLQTAHPYERGLDYNATIAAARAQAELGWQVEFSAAETDRDAAGSRTVAVTAQFLDRNERPLTGLQVRALLMRPATQEHDLEIDLTEQGGGRYVAETALPLAGQWDLTIIAHSAAESWQESRRIILP